MALSARSRRTLAVLALPGLVMVAADTTQARSSTGSPSPTQATGETESFVVVMAADPVVAYTGGEPGLAPTAPPVGDTVEPTDPAVEEYVDFLQAEQVEALDAAGISTSAKGQSFTFAVSGFEAQLTEAQAAGLQRRPEVAKVVPNELKQLTTDNTPTFLGLTGKQGAWAAGYTGEDVVVGVIDTGIWPEHASFADDGSYEPLDGFDEVECNFGDSAYNPDDVEFECNNKLLGAWDMRQTYIEQIGAETYNSARDSDGHGTHTASTAAGNGGVEAEIYGIDRGEVSGIAPRARVIAYAACGELGCFTSDLIGAIDQAVADGVDVINYSIGGGASLTGPDDIAFLFAADAGVWVATSNGNSGPGAGTVGGPASVPWVTSVGASTQNRTFSASARLGNGQIATGASITRGTGRSRPLVDAADLGNDICDPDEGFSADVTNKVVLCLRGVVDRVAKSQAVFEAGGAGMILYNPNNAQALVTDLHFVPSVHINFTSGTAIKAYIDAAGSAARATLTQGARVSSQGSVMADFSSRGPNPIGADLIKPDVTAPGVNVLAGHTPTPTAGAPGQLFQSISGTSMSSPHVAGLFALLRQAHPDWSAAAAKSAVMTSARQDVTKENAATPADPFDYGAGHVDPSGRPSRRGTMFSPGIVYDAQLIDYQAFLCGADPSVYVDPVGTCAAIEGGGYSTAATDLNVASIGASSVAGSLTIHRTVTSVADTYRVFRPVVEAPDGFEVDVWPRRLRLDPGETAKVEVTLTNVGATADEWRFGSLTWKSGRYEDRSPIAAKAALFSAPEAVSGEGTEGTVEIPVGFGYTGAYTAGAHGPVPTTRSEGTVGQDPDQTFDPADPEGTTAVPLEVTGTAHLRIALDTSDLTPADPDIDIDLYLFTEDGDFVASSTLGGTNEQIDVTLPPDGTHTLYVHGWQTLGDDVDFSLRSWQVPLAAGTGALTIDDAPTSATIGETDTVVASWSGLDPDETYLGAVSHSGDTGLLGLTLVDIAT